MNIRCSSRRQTTGTDSACRIRECMKSGKMVYFVELQDDYKYKKKVRFLRLSTGCCAVNSFSLQNFKLNIYSQHFKETFSTPQRHLTPFLYFLYHTRLLRELPATDPEQLNVIFHYLEILLDKPLPSHTVCCTIHVLFINDLLSFLRDILMVCLYEEIWKRESSFYSIQKVIKRKMKIDKKIVIRNF